MNQKISFELWSIFKIDSKAGTITKSSQFTKNDTFRGLCYKVVTHVANILLAIIKSRISS